MTAVESELSALYKNEYSRLLAVLTRIFGPENLQLAEDTLQEAFGKALVHWQNSGIPENPPAWIMRTAKNHAIDTIRAQKTKVKFAADLALFLESEWSLSYAVDQAFTEEEIKDDQLCMLFMCCHPEISRENQLPFILKILCGFTINAICRALLLSEATVKKRLLRTRQQIRNFRFELPKEEALPYAIDTVNTVLYLLFSEGFHSSDTNKSVNLSFCHEAMNLANMLIEEPRFANRETLALFALMHFHSARINTRVDDQGAPIPIDLQNREEWDTRFIRSGANLLGLAQNNAKNYSGRFFYEAQIAQEHCKAKHFSDTDWKKIIANYDQLIAITQLPVAKLNRAIAQAYSGALKTAIDEVNALCDEKIFKNTHQLAATLAHLHAMAGDKTKAMAFAEEAKIKGGTPAEHELMMLQLARLINRKN